MTDSPALEPEFEAARAYAARVHRAQVRNDATIRYVSHLLGVAALVLQDRGEPGGSDRRAPPRRVHAQGTQANTCIRVFQIQEDLARALRVFP